jgi:hypothetical protein
VVAALQASAVAEGPPLERGGEDVGVINALSYMPASKLRRERWSKADTEKFYRAIETVGCDFTMVAKCLPGRTRKQVSFRGITCHIPPWPRSQGPALWTTRFLLARRSACFAGPSCTVSQLKSFSLQDFLFSVDAHVWLGSCLPVCSSFFKLLSWNRSKSAFMPCR